MSIALTVSPASGRLPAGSSPLAAETNSYAGPVFIRFSFSVWKSSGNDKAFLIRKGPMPSGLIIKRPKTGPALAQLVIGALTAGPLLGLWYLWDHHLDVHFDHPWVNLGAHAALIVIPLIWAALISFTPVKFEPTEEIILGKTSFLDKFPFDWWTMLMLWPAAVVGTMAIGVALFTECLPHPEELSTSPLKALAIMVVTFCLGVFYGTMLLGNDEPRTLVSQAGLRTG